MAPPGLFQPDRARALVTCCGPQSALGLVNSGFKTTAEAEAILTPGYNRAVPCCAAVVCLDGFPRGKHGRQDCVITVVAASSLREPTVFLSGTMPQRPSLLFLFDRSLQAASHI